MPTGLEFGILLSFIKGDARFRKEVRYIMSISDKARIIDLYYNHVIKQIPRVETEFELVRVRGHLVSTESYKLLAYYEAYLDAIYSFLENISRMTSHFYSGKNLPPSFYKQREKFIKNSEWDIAYSTLLESMAWYEEFHCIRSESTHFLSGTITENQGKVGYWNEPRGKRKGTLPKIDIEDLREHIKATQQNVSNFKDSYATIFLSKIDGNKEVVHTCLVKDGQIGSKLLSLNQFLDNHPGRCNSLDFECPNASTCKARKSLVNS